MRNAWAVGALLLLGACGGRTDETTGTTSGAGAGAGAGSSVGGGSSSAGASSVGGSAAGGAAGCAGPSGSICECGSAVCIGGVWQCDCATGGAGGAGAGGGTSSGGAGGGVEACCTADLACGSGRECVSHVCKEAPPAGACWRDADCGPGATCQGGFVCACGAMCSESDAPGKCAAPAVDWSTCQKAGDCLLEPNSCCGTCGTPSTSDVDAVDWQMTQAHQTAVCPSPTPCPNCVGAENPDLAAFCTAGVCHVVEISKDDVSACTADADCTMHLDQCCDCGTGDPSQYVALAVSAVKAYESQVCGPNVEGGCGLGCVGSHPDGWAARCNPSTKHCEVAPIDGGGPACPPTEPQPFSPCSVPTPMGCEYGSQFVTGCRDHYGCQNGEWALAFPPAGVCPTVYQAGENGCPTSTALNGQTCPQNGLLCDLGGGLFCDCTMCPEGDVCSNVATWACTTPPPAPCPPIPPDVGQPCMPEGASCYYGVACDQSTSSRTCQGGVWVAGGIACGG